MCMLEGTTIFYLDVSQVSSETPFYVHPVASTQDQASQFLDRYANYSGDSNIADLQSLVKTYGLAGTSVEAVGESTLLVTNPIGTQNSPYMTLVRAPQGINNTYDNIILWYQKGVIRQFIDFWNRMPIGSFDVNLNQADALQIAEDAARNYSFSSGGETVSNFTLSNASNAVITDLQMQPRNGYLYPLYGFSLGLSRTFPGGITELQVGVWADTGQVAGINYVNSYGAPSGSSTTAASPEHSSTPIGVNQQNNASVQSIDTYIIAVVVAVALAVTVSLVALKKRKP